MTPEVSNKNSRQYLNSLLKKSWIKVIADPNARARAFILVLVNQAFQTAYDASSWPADDAIKAAWDKAISEPQISQEQAAFATNLANAGLNVEDIATGNSIPFA